MRILMVYDSISPHGGGSQEATLRWVENLVNLGIDIKLLCDQGIFNVPEAIPIDRVIVAKSVDAALVPGGRTTPFLLTPSLKKQILEFNPDILHIHEQLFLSPQVFRFAKDHAIPILSSFHGSCERFKSYTFPYSLFIHEGGIINRFVEKYQSDMLKNSDALTVSTQHYRRKLQHQTHKECFFLPYPVADSFFTQPIPKPSKVKNLITVSRLSGEKNIHVLIEMMQYLKNSFALTIVGDGLDRSYLEQYTKKLGVESCIKFVGWLKNSQLPQFLTQHHLFLSPSDFETFGITYVEALATHLPCVVYDYPVTREVIPRSAALFLPTFDPAQWAVVVQQLQDNKQKYQQMKDSIRKNYDQIKKYEEVQSTKRLIEIYTTFSKKFPRPRHRSTHHLD